MQKFGKNNPLGVAQMCLGGARNMSGWQYANVVARQNGWSPGCDPQVDALWNPKMIMGYAKNLMAFIRERSDLINNSDTKLDAVLAITRKYDNTKTICFSESTAFADKLALAINDDHNDVVAGEFGYYEICEVYHSNLDSRMLPSEKTGKLIKYGKDRLKKRAINRIKSGEARIISTAKALDRGFDVKDIRMGITSSGTRNPTQHSQRGGRVKRIENYEEDIIVLIVNVYFDGTVDEDKLRQRQKKSTNVVYWVETLDQINYKPKKNKVFNVNSI
jgi:superfamily II DNA or RNA helicase